MTTGAGDGIKVSRSAWSFAGSVAESFDAHVSKSVPMYTHGHELVCALTDYFVHSESVVYELGCSTGELTVKMARHNVESKPRARFIGIDVEPGMIKVAQSKRDSSSVPNVDFEVGNILDCEYEQCDMIVLYYTLQFVPVGVRQTLLNRLYEKLAWGGALVLFEKVRGADARFQDMLTGMYHDYKLAQGYSQDEIATKAASLRGVLEPFSVSGNIGLLERAGFKDIETIFKYICFQGFVAIK